MAITTFEKSDFTWYGISILHSSQTIDIVLLFKDPQHDGQKFFSLITGKNKHPSFYCILQPDKTHVLKIDYSSDSASDDYVAVRCNLTVDSYKGLNRLKEDHSFRIIIGTEQKIDGIMQVLCTGMNITPDKVKYLSWKESKLDREKLN